MHSARPRRSGRFQHRMCTYEQNKWHMEKEEPAARGADWHKCSIHGLKGWLRDWMAERATHDWVIEWLNGWLTEWITLGALPWTNSLSYLSPLPLAWITCWATSGNFLLFIASLLSCLLNFLSFGPPLSASTGLRYLSPQLSHWLNLEHLNFFLSKLFFGPPFGPPFSETAKVFLEPTPSSLSSQILQKPPLTKKPRRPFGP